MSNLWNTVYMRDCEDNLFDTFLQYRTGLSSHVLSPLSAHLPTPPHKFDPFQTGTWLAPVKTGR